MRLESKLDSLLNKVYAMLDIGKFPHFMRNGIWAKKANSAMIIENNLMVKSRDLSPFQQLFYYIREVS